MCLLVWAAWSAGAHAGPQGEDFEAGWQAARWSFSPGPEFPGAKGSFERSSEATHAGQYGGRLSFDFRGGGNYVGISLRLDNAPALAAVRLWLKRPEGHALTLRYTDQSGQTLQKSFWAPADRWVPVIVPFDTWTGHWGGANDGTIHGPPTSIALLVERGPQQLGDLLLDDLQLIEGEPGSGETTSVNEYTVFDFDDDEHWRMRADGNAGASSWQERRWTLDFSHGAKAISLIPREVSLLGDPSEIRIRARGKTAGHSVRLQIATHFMTFEKTIGQLTGEGPYELVVGAPPGEGWRWHGGENDGKRHGPLRLRALTVIPTGQADAATLELIDVRVKTSCVSNRQCVMTAHAEGSGDERKFVATVRSLAANSLQGQLTHTIRDWSGNTVSAGSTMMEIPPNGVAVSTVVPCAAEGRVFLEAEFVLDSPDQLIPAAQAYFTAPPEFVRLEQPRPSSPFGMGLYLYRYGSDPASLALMDRAAALGAAAGVTWSREEFSWSRIETAPGQYDWSFYDQMVATAKRHGICVYGLLAYWSPWTKPYTAQGIEDYCRFARAAADHFRDDIQHWEVYNEPNIFFWQGPRDMYAELLTQAYAAIKEANPQAHVLGCSTAGIDLPFIRRTIELGAPFDILTIHPYRGQLDDRQFISDLQQAAQVAKSPDGTVRPVWITEMGWATHVPHNSSTEGFGVTTQRDQAHKLARAYIDAMASGVTPNISWYDFRNDGDDPFNFEHNLGIVTDRFELKPAYRAFATLTRWLEGYRVDQQLPLPDSFMAYRFRCDGEGPTVIAAWSTDTRREVEFPISGPRVRVVNLMDEITELSVSQGIVRVSVERDCPVLIVSQRARDTSPEGEDDPADKKQ
ncbi:MAG: beta-galactosidase [Pirellulaceae bacterium]